MKDSAFQNSEACFFRFTRAHLISTTSAFFWTVFLGLTVTSAAGDELRTIHGERLVGKAVSVSDKTVVFWSTTLGKITVQRTNVASINLAGTLNEPAASTNSAVVGSYGETNRLVPAVLPSVSGQLHAKEQVDDLLAQAGPEATARFNQMLKGLMSGNMSMAELRAQAVAVRDQARALRTGLDEETGGVLDSYLAILDKFLAQNPNQAAKTNSAVRPLR